MCSQVVRRPMLRCSAFGVRSSAICTDDDTGAAPVDTKNVKKKRGS
jgi:hypothetical protein